MSHTASIAGGPGLLFDPVVRHAGAIVADDFNTFDDLFYIAGALHGKQIGGRRLGAISGAGFEAVGMADSDRIRDLRDGDGRAGSRHGDATGRHPQGQAAGTPWSRCAIPIDINPGADDESYLQIVEAFLQDPNIDAVQVGLDPTAPGARAESSKLRPGFDISDPEEHGAPDAAAGQSQREADHRHRRWRQPLRWS